MVWQVVRQGGFDRFKASEKGLIIVWQIKNLFDKKFHAAQNQVVWQIQMKIEKKPNHLATIGLTNTNCIWQNVFDNVFDN